MKIETIGPFPDFHQRGAIRCPRCDVRVEFMIPRTSDLFSYHVENDYLLAKCNELSARCAKLELQLNGLE